mmetsp:Transcript_1794/g.3644  ORF Transcript_1794/g.3644 Transcript_1794/m.3644 type:complete len:220 (+) Transcript_1794:342-1001(+)|eukprot:CAMPEP_0181310258 /NCGR_PEP_ID=MMETSP1101-20121128/12488_1 /TAXON_ID=46948 /ORGANISM="Rhodomonas abbreviata, Strain Caron Lab Isolate" /LENGTH=219 /DNA_ID=CAMNT_0023416871 /DNA_START=341 /DNA_END=1000 /DNA_ORIENTATION=+
MSKAATAKAGAAAGSRPKTSDGETDFAFTQGQSAPKAENLTSLLNNYIPHDQEAFNRLVKPSLKQQAQALDVAKVAMSGLDKVMEFLNQRRKTCGDQITADEEETRFIEKEIAKKEAATEKIRKHQTECKVERDAMQKALKESVETMQETVKHCHKMTQKTNSNIARLTRTMVPQGRPNYLMSGTMKAGTSSMATTGAAGTAGLTTKPASSRSPMAKTK